MTDPCINNDCVDAGLVRRFDLFKWLIMALLLGLLALLLMRQCGRAPAATVPAAPIATTPAAAAPIATTPAAAAPAAAAPTLNVAAAEMLAGEVELSGTGDPNSTVELFANDESLGTAVVDGSGNWQFTAPLAAGVYALRAAVAGEGVDLTSAARNLTLYDLPTIDNPGDELSTGSFALSGRGTPGSMIEILQDGASVGMITVGADGSWSYDLDLEAGRHEVEARLVDGSDRSLGQSAPVPLLAAIPEMTIPTFDLPDFDLPDFDPSLGLFTLTGRGLPGSLIEIVRDGIVVGTAEVGADGLWSFDLEGFEPGLAYSLLARTSNADGSATAESAPFRLDWPALPVVEAAGPVILGANATVDGQPLTGFFGEGTPGTTLDILNDAGERVGQATVRADGSWRCSCALPPGTYDLQVQETGRPESASDFIVLEVANLSPAYEQPVVAPDPNAPRFTCSGTPDPGRIEGSQYIVAACESMDLIASRLGTTIEDLIAFNPQVDNPRKIWAGQVLNIPSDAGCFDAPEG